MASQRRTGPLAGTTVIELGSGIAPVPFAAMMLANMGARVVRVARPGQRMTHDILGRGRESVTADLKTSEGVEFTIRLAERADVLLEGFRPGVLERLGLGPDILHEHNPRLVIGRLTGLGREGEWANRASWDMNCIAIAGVLAHLGPAGQPLPPLGLVGDFGGGGMLLVAGVLAALCEAKTSGMGDVVDASILDGAATLMAASWGMLADGAFDEHRRESNFADGGAPNYTTYRCHDDRFIAVAAMTPGAYQQLLDATSLDLNDERADGMTAREGWPQLREDLAAKFAMCPSSYWVDELNRRGVGAAPVLTMSEAALLPHNEQRGTFISLDGIPQPAPAPRFGRHDPPVLASAPEPGEHTAALIAELRQA